jgi:hypothetical protein
MMRQALVPGPAVDLAGREQCPGGLEGLPGGSAPADRVLQCGFRPGQVTVPGPQQAAAAGRASHRELPAQLGRPRFVRLEDVLRLVELAQAHERLDLVGQETPQRRLQPPAPRGGLDERAEQLVDFGRVPLRQAGHAEGVGAHPGHH